MENSYEAPSATKAPIRNCCNVRFRCCNYRHYISKHYRAHSGTVIVLFQQFLLGEFMVQEFITEPFNVSFTIEGEAIMTELA